MSEKKISIITNTNDISASDLSVASENDGA